MTVETGEPTSFGIFLDGKRFDGIFHSHDHAKQQVRRMERALNRHGYDPRSERLTISPVEDV